MMMTMMMMMILVYIYIADDDEDDDCDDDKCSVCSMRSPFHNPTPDHSCKEQVGGAPSYPCQHTSPSRHVEGNSS